jgi:hypothetical protein
MKTVSVFNTDLFEYSLGLNTKGILCHRWDMTVYLLIFRSPEIDCTTYMQAFSKYASSKKISKKNLTTIVFQNNIPILASEVGHIRN